LATFFEIPAPCTPLAEEMPEAYKDISQVVNVVHGAVISKKVAKLKPIGVIKG